MTKPLLHHNDMSVCAAKVRSAFAEKDIAYDHVHLDLRAGDSQKPEYTRLNPNQVVPTLMHEGVPIIESNVILEYIDDTWPEQPLRPKAPLDRARMRLWNKQLDDGLHAATGTISVCIAFRHQHLQRKPEDFQAWVTPGHRIGVEQWFNPRYLEIFSRESPAARERLRLLASR